MAYAVWSVVANEQPSTAKWNILGTNDASFHDGTGIALTPTTGSNAGTGGGSTNYINLNGFKIMWGITNQSSNVTAGGTLAWGVTFPIAFSAAPTMTATLENHTGSTNALTFNGSDPTTTAAVNLSILNNSAGGMTAKIAWHAFGT